jgi:hypothetical protein
VSIGLAAERIATSLKIDTWQWSGTRLCRSDFAIAVNLKGECYASFNGHLGFDVLPMTKAERKMLSKVANEKLQSLIAGLANSPAHDKGEPKP